MMHKNLSGIRCIYLTQKETKEQSEYANIQDCYKAVLLFGIADFCLMFLVNNRRLVSNPTTGFYRI